MARRQRKRPSLWANLLAFPIALLNTYVKVSRQYRLDKAHLDKTAADIADKRLAAAERKARIMEIRARTEYNRIRNEVMRRALDTGANPLANDKIMDICPDCSTHYSQQLNKTTCDDCGTRLTQTVLEL